MSGEIPDYVMAQDKHLADQAGKATPTEADRAAEDALWVVYGIPQGQFATIAIDDASEVMMERVRSLSLDLRMERARYKAEAMAWREADRTHFAEDHNTWLAALAAARKIANENERAEHRETASQNLSRSVQRREAAGGPQE